LWITSHIHVEAYGAVYFLLFHALYLLTHLQAPLALFCYEDTASTQPYPLSLHDALPIYRRRPHHLPRRRRDGPQRRRLRRCGPRSEEHTSELQSRFDLVCRLLLEKKTKMKKENE